MRIGIRFSVAGDRLAVRIPRADIDIEEPNEAAVDRASGAVLALGEAARRLAGARGAEVDIRPVFDARAFDPAITSAAVRWFASLARTRVRRGWSGVLSNPLADRIDYDLHLAGFDGLPDEAQDALIHRLLVAQVSRVIVNGTDLTSRPIHLRRANPRSRALSRNAGPIVLVGLVTMLIVMFVLTAVLPYCPEGQERRCEGAVLGKLVGLVCECV